ncbi:MAG: gamma-glutamylcyclotransferase [Streptomycetaceae bacterium]|nr:gamma-glutamylcyclotransferase [Streptomycetaceae bacterium]
MPLIGTPSHPRDSAGSTRADRRSADPDRLFVYGSLMFPEVLAALLGRIPDRSPARMSGWRAAALPDRVYPVLVRDPSADASGALLTGISAAEWEILDAYEEDLYDLLRLPLEGGGHAWTYVAPEGADAPEGFWSADEFADRHLAAYVAACRVWRGGFAESAAGGDAS